MDTRHLFRVGLQVEQIPFAGPRKEHQFVAIRAHAIVPWDIMDGRIFVVRVVNGIAP